jgi:hypothetical protein
MYCGLFIIPSGLLSLVKIPCIVLYNINDDKDTTNIVSLQMNVGFNTYCYVIILYHNW